MQVSCPNCLKENEIPEAEISASIFCNSCGYSFSPRRNRIEDEPTYVPVRPGFQPEAYSEIGEYEILEELGRGGMGVVFKAYDRKLKRFVALKMILATDFSERSQILRFQSEAESAARLDHSGIVPVYEFGEHLGQPFLVMSYVEGGTVSDRLKHEPFHPLAAARIIKQVAEAVHYAHQQGVIHRDLKPRNILLHRDGTPRVSDFGLAKLVDSELELTATGEALGTPAYMPPEQVVGSGVGLAADIYSLGATLYAMLTGRAPFHDENLPGIMHQVLHQKPSSPRLLNPQVSRDLETICLKCLRKDPRQRYESAAALADDLQRWLDHKPIRARRASPIERLRSFVRRRPAVAIALMTSSAAILLLILLNLVMNRGQSERKQLQTKLAWKQMLEQNLIIDRLVALALTADYPEAVLQSEQILERGPLTAMMYYDLACVFSLASEAVHQDQKLSVIQADALRVKYSEKSVDLLASALENGYFSTHEERSLLNDDPHLEPVRGESRFQELLNSLSASHR